MASIAPAASSRIGDGIRDRLLFEGTGCFGELLRHDPTDLWMRLLLAAGLWVFGVVVPED
jgi:hypothetical protein